MPESNKIIKQLLDEKVELSDMGLDKLTATELIQAIVLLRANVLMLTSLVGVLSEQIRMVDDFARPQTTRLYYAPLKRRIQ